MAKKVHNITDAAPTLETETRSKVKAGALIGVTALGLLLLADDQVKRFKARKDVHVVVEDKPQPKSNN